MAGGPQAGVQTVLPGGAAYEAQETQAARIEPEERGQTTGREAR